MVRLWADRVEIAFLTFLDAAKRRLAGRRRIMLGLLNGALIRNADPAHVWIVGPTRSGKGTCFTLPNSYDHDRWDVKREN